MADCDERKDRELRATVDEGRRLRLFKGASVAANFMYRFGVPTPVIERVIYADHRDLPNGKPVPLSEVLATHELATRIAASPANFPAASPQAGATLSDLVDRLRVHLQVDAVGISKFSRSCEELTWIEISGELAQFKGRRFPRRHSMCDVCFRTAQSQLFVRPQLHFRWMADNGIFVNEALITPLRGGRAELFLGTLWAVTVSDDSPLFNAGHLGVLRKYAEPVEKILQPVLQ
ncbi:MAG TPA: hypothetical protein VGC21_21435 [Telluria sp.]|jgi:hypothetical protein